jgi:hypothetical protein
MERAEWTGQTTLSHVRKFQSSRRLHLSFEQGNIAKTN